MKRALIVINGYPSGEKFYTQAQRIAEELRSRGVQTDIVKNGDILAALTASGTVQLLYAQKYDFCVYLDKDKYLGELLQKTGLRLFNTPQAIADCDDKMRTYVLLAGKVNLVDTVPAPLCYTKGAKVSEENLKKIADFLGFPMVAKKSYGSFGAGVQLVHGMPELIKTAQEFLHEPHCFQRFIEASKGRDVRVIVIGGKAVCAMERVAQEGEFRSNVELGAMGRKICLSTAYKAAAEECASVLGLDYCGVDLLHGKTGPIVCEVNSNAFFEGIEKVTGVNVAAAYAEYILSTM